jgi:exocyst complex component 8
VPRLVQVSANLLARSSATPSFNKHISTAAYKRINRLFDPNDIAAEPAIMEKGVSLRQKRTGKLKISQPTLISAPRAATTNTVEIASVSSQRQTPNGSTTTLASTATRPRERTRDARTADLVKRRYSTRLTGAQDLGLPDEPVPLLPSIPKQFTIPPPSRDGGSSIRSFRNQGVDIAILNDPNFDADECKT